MDLLLWFVHWFYSAAIYVQIAFDTGWLSEQMTTMPARMQIIHDRLTAWILEDEEKK